MILESLLYVVDKVIWMVYCENGVVVVIIFNDFGYVEIFDFNYDLVSVFVKLIGIFIIDDE